MIITDEDIRILKIFLSKNNCKTTWQLMKKIYPNGSNQEHMRIKGRIKRLAGNDLILITKDNFFLVGEKVKLKKIKFDKINLDSICILTNRKWMAFQI